MNLFQFPSLDSLPFSLTPPFLFQDYTPTQKDILHARKATKGITEFTIMINEVPFCFVDVGGQRSQRQKWYQCFDCVTSILFLVSSSEFDQVLVEDRSGFVQPLNFIFGFYFWYKVIKSSLFLVQMILRKVTLILNAYKQ